jgi:hypothetical protein
MRVICEVVCLGQQNNGNDDAVDGDGLTEDDTDQILGFDTRHLDRTTQQGTACDEDTPNKELGNLQNHPNFENLPSSSDDGQSERECNSHVSPGGGISAVKNVLPALVPWDRSRAINWHIICYYRLYYII